MKIIYTSLEQRMAAFYYLTMPKFIAYPNDFCEEEEQKNLHTFLYELYKTIFFDPTVIFNELHDDDSFPNPFNCASYHHDTLLVNMKKDIKLIDNFILLLMDIGKNGIFHSEEVKYQKDILPVYLKLLKLGQIEYNDDILINQGKPFFKALKWFANDSMTSLRRFSTAAFNPNYNYLEEILMSLCNSELGACEKIITWLKEHDYKPILFQNDEYKVDYVKNVHGFTQNVGSSFFGDANHIGFSMEYRYTGRKPQYGTIRLLRMGQILDDFAILPTNIQDFIMSKNKKCHHCNYCVKNGISVSKMYIRVKYHKRSYLLCPLFQGFLYSFRDISNIDAENIISFLELLEKYNIEDE